MLQLPNAISSAVDVPRAPAGIGDVILSVQTGDLAA